MPSVQLLSRVWLWDPRDCSTPGFPVRYNSQSLLKLMSIESVMPSNHLIVCRPLLLLPSVFPGIRVFSNESALRIRWPKYWSFSFSISPSNEYSGLISFRTDWFDLLAVQGTLKSLHQHHQISHTCPLVFSFTAHLSYSLVIPTWLLTLTPLYIKQPKWFINVSNHITPWVKPINVFLPTVPQVSQNSSPDLHVVTWSLPASSSSPLLFALPPCTDPSLTWQALSDLRAFVSTPGDSFFLEGLFPIVCKAGSFSSFR